MRNPLPLFVFIGLCALLATEAAAKPKKRKKAKPAKESTEAPAEAAEASQLAPTPAAAAAPAASAATPVSTQEVIIEKKTDTGVYLAIGLGRALNSKMRITTKSAIENTNVSFTQKTNYTLAAGPVLSLEVMQFNTGKMGFSFGAFFEQGRPITSVELDDGTSKQIVDNQGLTFSQFGAQINVLVAGEIPYGYLGANFGSAELKDQVDDGTKTTLKGELGGQFGIGLRIGKYAALEGSYRITQFSKEDENLLGRTRSSVFMESTIATIKLTLN